MSFSEKLLFYLDFILRNTESPFIFNGLGRLRGCSFLFPMLRVPMAKAVFRCFVSLGLTDSQSEAQGGWQPNLGEDRIGSFQVAQVVPTRCSLPEFWSRFNRTSMYTLRDL